MRKKNFQCFIQSLFINKNNNKNSHKNTNNRREMELKGRKINKWIIKNVQYRNMKEFGRDSSWKAI
jgi:hypothetical protein